MHEDVKKPKEITVSVNNQDVELDSKHVTGAQVKAAASVPAEFQLFREQGQKLKPITDEEEITVHDGERFRAVSGQDVS